MTIERFQYNSTEWRDKLWENDLKVRKIGLAFLGGALFLGCMGIYIPHMEAIEGKNKILIFEMSPIVMMISFMFGLLMLIMGKRAESLLRVDKKAPVTVLKLLTYIIIFSLGVFIAICFKNWLIGLGYRIDLN